jgi:hypothetical protein
VRNYAASLRVDHARGIPSTPSTRALEAVIRDLIETRDGATNFAQRVWGISLRYDLGSSHPLVDRSFPNFERVDGTTVGSLLREVKGLSLDFDPSASLQTLLSSWRKRVTYVAGEVRDQLAALVRCS